MRKQPLNQLLNHRGILGASLIVLILCGLFVLPVSAETAERCDFSAADSVLIDNFRSGQAYKSTTLADPDIMRAPESWQGASFWQGYGSPDPLDSFLDLKPLYTAIYYRHDGERQRLIGIVWVSHYGPDTVRALLLDPPNLPHGCAALEMPRQVADEWFNSAFEGGS